MKKLLPITLLACTFFCFTGFAQVTGTITDTENAPLPGVSIIIVGSTTGTTSDFDGNYSINASEGDILQFSYVGMTTVTRTVGESDIIDVVLEEDAQALDEVVVTAMGIERSERSLGYAAQKVDTELLNMNKQPNVVNSLQGKVAGVSINSTGGAPGQGANIQIRGINSIDPRRDNQPLFVIDGVIIDNTTSTFGSGSNLRGMSNRAADLNPDDIETINILKGGAATALYGLRGANGVVVITTRSGKAGTIRVNYTSTYGVDYVNKFPDIQNKYTQGWMGQYDPDDFWPSWGPTVEEARAIDPTHPAKLYNHVKDAFQTGSQVRNNLSFSGGNETITFLASLSQFDQTGILPSTDYKNYQARLNTDVKLSDKFKTGMTMSYINSGGYRYNAIRYNEQLVYWSGRHDVTDFREENGTMRSYGGTSNPMYVAHTNRLKDDVDRFIGSVYFDYRPTEWLNLNYRVGIDNYNENRLRTAPGIQGLEGERIVNDNGTSAAPGRGLIYDYNTRFETINSTFVASGTHSFSDELTGTLRVGHEFYTRKVKNTGVEGADLTVYNWFDLRNANILNTVQEQSQYRLMGAFGELSFDYNNYLFLTLTARNDWTSSLLKPNNAFFYPSASLSYIFSENLSLPEVISNGKFRFSYAKIGKDADVYSTSGGFANYMDLPPGYVGFTRPNLLGDPDLRPEFTDTYEAGLEMSFFNSRLGFDFTYYHSTSKDQIIQVPISSATGFELASINAGSMRNKGVELTLFATPIKKENFSWETQVNFSANRNRILSIHEDLDEITLASQSGYVGATVTMKLVPGEAYGSLFGTVHQRYYTDEEIQAGLKDGLHVDKSRPIVIDEDGFPVREPVSVQKILGNVQPKWIGGWSNTFRYKNVSLTTLMDARIGQYRYNQQANFYSAFGMSEITENRNDYKVFNGVLANGTPNTQEVWLGQGIDPGTGRDYGIGYYRNYYRGVSENFVEDASWVRLRSVSLTYSLPKRWLEDSFVRNMSFTATGNNLWLWTKYTGYDPESSSFSSGSNIDGFAGFTYPALRSFLFTLNVEL
ncbi:SusC/RagA family TonB-linked outer membrane protein [Sinomicrobium sp. M5D2P9]